ncbi:MAG: hypothetical protein ACLQME_03535, partial [Alphaproteobacteria bacterium]
AVRGPSAKRASPKATKTAIRTRRNPVPSLEGGYDGPDLGKMQAKGTFEGPVRPDHDGLVDLFRAPLQESGFAQAGQHPSTGLVGHHLDEKASDIGLAQLEPARLRKRELDHPNRTGTELPCPKPIGKASDLALEFRFESLLDLLVVIVNEGFDRFGRRDVHRSQGVKEFGYEEDDVALRADQAFECLAVCRTLGKPIENSLSRLPEGDQESDIAARLRPIIARLLGHAAVASAAPATRTR